MIKKITSTFVFFCFTLINIAQTINVSNITTSGRFSSCNLGLPTVTASFVSGNGAMVVNGALACINPSDTTTIKVIIGNLQWSQGPDVNWMHGFFIPTNPNYSMASINSAPANWYFTTGCTGACPTGTTITGGLGMYYAGSGPGAAPCCANGGTTATPCDNWGDPTFTCGTPGSFSFNLKIKNSSISSNLQFILRGTSDGNTGCWNIGDAITSRVIFQIAGIACSTNPSLRNSVANTTYTTNLAGPYQWQNSTDSVQFNNITDNANYSGTNGSALGLSNISSNRYGEQFRCVVNGINGQVFTLKFSNTWTGAINNDWNNAGNWSCGTVPDQYTDVIINFGSVVLSANTTIRSLSIKPNATITTSTGVVLNILH